MSSPRQDFTKLSFARNFVLPALLIFLVPGISLLFFQHAQDRFDSQFREASLESVQKDTSLSEEDRAQTIEVIKAVPFSRLLLNAQFAAQFDFWTRFNMATFRWMIRLSLWSMIGGGAIIALAVLSSFFAQRSQQVQYWTLVAGWHVLQIYSALQTVVLGILLIALSFWVTALWGEVYYVKLIVIAGLLAIVAVAAVIKAIFTVPSAEFAVEGTVISRNDSSPLWQELQSICEQVGSPPPDHVIAGIDDNFFVTEHTVSVGNRKCPGKTLFVSLSLLKQLDASEARAILAHEMAHFSGNDTLYSRRIGPLLLRFDNYLQALHSGITLPVFHFMVCFRVLFELSLRQVSREREFRADRIAAETTSPRVVAGALLRTIAYSHFREKVQTELFREQQALETANVRERIEHGFPQFAASFISTTDIGALESSHPFDSHPSLSRRLNSLGVEFEPRQMESLLTATGDGGWRQHIPEADALEQAQWSEFEQQFRNFHEASLPYRYLPETDAEREVVEKAFPPIAFNGGGCTLTLDYERLEFSGWDAPIFYREIQKCQYHDHGWLSIHILRDAMFIHEKLPITKFPKDEHGNILAAFQNYYGRHLAALEYRKQIRAEPST